jgi:hypothetical protein
MKNIEQGGVGGKSARKWVDREGNTTDPAFRTFGTHRKNECFVPTPDKERLRIRMHN